MRVAQVLLRMPERLATFALQGPPRCDVRLYLHPQAAEFGESPHLGSVRAPLYWHYEVRCQRGFFSGSWFRLLDRSSMASCTLMCMANSSFRISVRACFCPSCVS